MEIDGVATVPDLDRWLAERGLAGLWGDDTAPRDDSPYPPFLWKWADVQEALARIGPALDQDPALAERMAGYKHFGFDHPGLPAGAAPTINMGAQVLSPGEHGEARRHMQAEFRFIIRGNPRAYAVVEGERFPMETGDLLGTPAWAWYDWANEGDEPVYWLNVGDITLTRLAYRFREVHPQRRQPIDKPAGYWARRAGPARPASIDHDLPTPPFRHPWIETYRALRAMSSAAADPFDGLVRTFPHPLTGGPTSPTLAIEAQLLRSNTRTRAGAKARAHRHTCTTRYHVVQGRGATVVGDTRLEWSFHDSFIVPPWSWHHHGSLASEDAILLSVTDRPIVQALGLYREEAREPDGTTS